MARVIISNGHDRTFREMHGLRRLEGSAVRPYLRSTDPPITWFIIHGHSHRDRMFQRAVWAAARKIAGWVLLAAIVIALWAGVIIGYIAAYQQFGG